MIITIKLVCLNMLLTIAHNETQKILNIKILLNFTEIQHSIVYVIA